VILCGAVAGQKLTELKGADPQALEAYVTQLAVLGVESVPAALRKFALEFEDCFNRDDLEGVMDAFAEEGAVYITFDGTRFEGKEAIRAEFAPMLSADSPSVRFHVESTTADTSTGTCTVTWVCEMAGVEEGQPGKSWRGLDILKVENSKVVSKETFGKASKLKLEEEVRACPVPPDLLSLISATCSRPLRLTCPGTTS
jgi:ketosteroid isomerase-like protein